MFLLNINVFRFIVNKSSWMILDVMRVKYRGNDVLWNMFLMYCKKNN